MRKKKIKSEVARSKLKEFIKCQLWGIVAGRCEFCNKLLYSDTTFGITGNRSQVAHIHAVSENGPRHAKNMSNDDLNSIDNLMLLCPEHHKMIDDDPEEFCSDILHKRKQEHRTRIRLSTDNSDYRTCKMVSYITPIDQSEPKGSVEAFKRALIKEGYAPGQDVFIDLSSNDVPVERTKESYELRAKTLEQNFNRRVYDITHPKEAIAIFALGPMPLLIKLGTLLNDQYYVKVFQCHRSGDKWSWKDSCKMIEYRVYGLERLENGCDEVALNLSLSARINNSRIKNVVGENIPVVNVTIDEPSRDFVTQEIIADEFVRTFRDVMEEIKCRANPDRILVFPAMPVSLAVRLGQDYMFKTDPELVVFDEDGGMFIETISIGGV